MKENISEFFFENLTKFLFTYVTLSLTQFHEISRKRERKKNIHFEKRLLSKREEKLRK